VADATANLAAQEKALDDILKQMAAKKTDIEAARVAVTKANEAYEIEKAKACANAEPKKLKMSEWIVKDFYAIGQDGYAGPVRPAAGINVFDRIQTPTGGRVTYWVVPGDDRVKMYAVSVDRYGRLFTSGIPSELYLCMPMNGDLKNPPICEESVDRMRLYFSADSHFSFVQSQIPIQSTIVAIEKAAAEAKVTVAPPYVFQAKYVARDSPGWQRAAHTTMSAPLLPLESSDPTGPIY
jgi:hypothetical protein